MRTLLLSFVMAAFLFAGCNSSENENKPEARVESAHSDTFNHSIQNVLKHYNALTEAFVNWDSTLLPGLENNLENALTEWKLEEISRDSAAYQLARANYDRVNLQMKDMKHAVTMLQKRRELDTMSRKLYDLLDAVAYDEKKLYLQKCPMAFNDTETAMWLTDKGKDSIRNPYLGTRHPKYGDGMLECGENEFVLDKMK